MATPSLRGRLPRLANPRKPTLKPNKPLILANRVGERRREKGEATCITEMSVMMACWKENEFRDSACKKEIQDFFECASRTQTGFCYVAQAGLELAVILLPQPPKCWDSRKPER
ncbi:coiled-coil-helix-coiled-coil-helix domain-containing protein 1 isoform X2 [Heterocephalus glaber]|uniref:Coiled-coil-helix-coiled-coil-helix domain-containing protein 1 isoform X2 n=1 Tax=Heterocephalus glaber TaxID=10181 RepID=A0AAX6T5U0_HETGA|nr:coiled-coil-helix-coiled-coil-helix domain-containing protein 1 isoform X2 [Heterocephalus glaber]